MNTTRINPLTYAIDPLRQVVFAAQNLPPAALQRLPIAAELGIVAAFALIFLGLAVRAFGRVDVVPGGMDIDNHGGTR